MGRGFIFYFIVLKCREPSIRTFIHSNTVVPCICFCVCIFQVFPSMTAMGHLWTRRHSGCWRRSLLSCATWSLSSRPFLTSQPRQLTKVIYPKKISTVRAPVFGRHQFFGTSEHFGKTHGSLLSRWMNYNYTAFCWFPTSSNILILPSQFWQIRFESYWLHCSKCRKLVLLRYHEQWRWSLFLWMLVQWTSTNVSLSNIKNICFGYRYTLKTSFDIVEGWRLHFFLFFTLMFVLYDDVQMDQ